MDFSALNDIPKLVSPRWDAIIGYGAGALCSLQCMKSTWRGSKEILNAFCGEESYRDRIQKAATDNLNIFSNAKNMTVGSDSFRTRFKHFQDGLENLFIGGITGLFAYLLFFEVFDQSKTQPSAKPEPYGTFEQTFKSSVQNAKKQVDPFQEKNCFAAIIFHPNVHSQLVQCQTKGYLSPTFDFESIHHPAQREIAASCLKAYELFLKARSLFVNDPVFEEAIDQYTSDNPEISLIEGPKSQVQVSTAKPQTGRQPRAVTLFNNQNWNLLDPIVQNYFALLQGEIGTVVKQSEEYLNRHQDRLDYHKTNNMTMNWAPISIDIAQACDKNFFNKLPFGGKELTSLFCKEYSELKHDLDEAENTYLATKRELSLDYVSMSCEKRRDQYLAGLNEQNTLLNRRQFKFYDTCRKSEDQKQQEALSRKNP